MAIIRSGATTDELTIDPTSKAARATLYDTAGNVIGAGGKASYQASGRLTGGTGLSFGFTSATSKQFLTIYHANTATKTVRLTKAWVSIMSCSAATQILAELVSLTNAATPATGNPAITPQKFNLGDAAAEATVLALPTTPGTESATTTGFGSVCIDFTGASANTSPLITPPVMLYEYWPMQFTEQPVMRAATAEGWAIRLFPNATTPTVVATCGFEFTEE